MWWLLLEACGPPNGSVARPDTHPVADTTPAADSGARPEDPPDTDAAGETDPSSETDLDTDPAPALPDSGGAPPIDTGHTDTPPTDTAAARDTQVDPCAPGSPAPQGCIQDGACLYPGTPPPEPSFEASYRAAYDGYWQYGQSWVAVYPCTSDAGRQLHVIWNGGVGFGAAASFYDAATGQLVALYGSSDTNEFCRTLSEGWSYEVLDECVPPRQQVVHGDCLACSPNPGCGDFQVPLPLGVTLPAPVPIRSEVSWDTGEAGCLPGCGDGDLDPGEQCDDGNEDNGDVCNAACALACGNRWVEPSAGEACDDGNRVDGDGCSSTCELETPPCGDSAGCPVCGDGALESPEACDDGNTAAADGCAPDCALECGDGQMQVGELCEDGGVTPFDGCDARCAWECGNGTLEPQETCDDHNRTRGDGCDAACLVECGNHRPDPNEDCDDGNVVSGDGCSATCTSECGDGALGLLEPCDPSVPGTTGCSPYCTFTCGDGARDGWEQCDDMNTDPTDGCDACNVRVHGVAAAAGVVCGLDGRGEIHCWGRGFLAPPAGVWSRLSASGDGICAIDAAGAATCWGATSRDPIVGVPNPIVDASVRSYVAQAGWVSELWAVDSSGAVYRDGTRQHGFGVGNVAVRRDNSGGMVLNSVTGAATPTSAAGAGSPAGVRLVSIAYKDRSYCGLSGTGDAVCWAAFPPQVGPLHTPPPGPFLHLDVGEGQAAAVRPDGTLAWWGEDAAFMEGVTPADVRFTEIAVGNTTYQRGLACGVRNDGILHCFGDGAPLPAPRP